MNNDHISNIKEAFAILAEVESFTLEERIENYKSGKATERDVKIYVQIASAYRQFCINHPSISLDQKKEIVLLLLRMTMGMEYSDAAKYIDSTQLVDLEKVFKETVYKAMQKLDSE